MGWVVVWVGGNRGDSLTLPGWWRKEIIEFIPTMSGQRACCSFGWMSARGLMSDLNSMNKNCCVSGMTAE